MRTERTFLLCLWLTLGGTAAGAQPLSAIDWLTDSVNAPPAPPVAAEVPASPPETTTISVRPLGAPSLDGAGTLDPAVVGLGRDLWSASDVPTLARLIDGSRAERLPALRGFLIRLMQVRSDPPQAAKRDGDLLLARIDRLLELGALTEAAALLEKSDLSRPSFFRRWFDTQLLLGEATPACERLAEAPGLDPTVPTRVFCLARLGDWEAAALNLETGVALGEVTPADNALLRRYLDESTAAENGPLTLPNRITPLTFRLYEAIGEPAPTNVLPRAFAHADLVETNGWRNRMRAAERLASAGVLPPERLFDLYREHKPSASGGIFDRAALVQDFEDALRSRVPGAVAEVLPQLWSEMETADIGPGFAQVYAGKLAAFPLEGAAGKLAHRIGLLAGLGKTGRGGQFVDALARGTPTLAAATDTRAGQIQQGYSGDGLPVPLQALLDEGRTGEAVLTALDLFATGADGDGEDLISAIRLLRALGLEPLARQASLELMLLDPRG